VTSATAAALYRRAELGWAAAEGQAALNLLAELLTVVDHLDTITTPQLHAELRRIATLVQRHPPVGGW
jgi:hypothetical protein